MQRNVPVNLNQKGLWCVHKGERAHVTPHTPEALLMRLSVASLRRVVKGDLAIQFVPQALTSYGGLEVVPRYVHPISLPARPRPSRGGPRRGHRNPRPGLP